MTLDPLFKPDLEKTLEHYGIFVPSYGAGWVKILCPRFDHPERRASATVNLDAGKWNCFVCGTAADGPGGGDSLDIIQWNEGLPGPVEAAAWAQSQGLPGKAEAGDSRHQRKPRGGNRSRGDAGRKSTERRVGRWH